MGEAAGDGRLVALALEAGGDRRIARPAREPGAAVEDTVFGIDRLGIGLGAGVGARRMAGDEIVDLEPVLDGAQAVFECG
jgi:hypothetical protein